jgi:hypothetical protein
MTHGNNEVGTSAKCENLSDTADGKSIIQLFL